MIACQPIYGGTLMIIGCSGSGSTSGFMTGSVGGIFGRSYICVGKQDTVSGTAEVWSIQWDYGFDPWHVYIWKATITGSDPSAVAAMGSLGTDGHADAGLLRLQHANDRLHERGSCIRSVR
jgi:hypothetical protein